MEIPDNLFFKGGGVPSADKVCGPDGYSPPMWHLGGRWNPDVERAAMDAWKGVVSAQYVPAAASTSMRTGSRAYKNS